MSSENPSFIHLNAHSSFSLLEGIPHPKKLGSTAAKMGFPALGVVDNNSLFSAVEMSTKFTGDGVQPVIGTQLGLLVPEAYNCNQLPAQITLLIQNETGWRNLMHLSSQAFLHAPENMAPQIDFSILDGHTEGLICLTGGGRDGLIGRLLQNEKDELAENYLQKLSAHFPDNRLYVEIQRHNLPEELETEAQLVEWAYKYNLPLVATNDPRYIKKDQFEAFNALLAIGQGCTLQEINDPDNRTKFRTFSDQHYLKTEEEMCALFADLPEATANTVEIAKRCAFVVPTGTYYMPAWIDKDTREQVQDVDDLMRKEAEEGLDERLEKFVYTPEMSDEDKAEKRKEYFDRLKFEMDIVIRMGYSGYFLITSDFIRWAKDNDIPVGPGRGSGAGSIAAWALKITDLDPIAWGLYFERFLNPERVSLPDFDIDFCQERRGEVIRYVREHYGHEAVSQIITFGTLKARACIRDVGRVLQIPFGAVSRIAAFIPEGPASIPVDKALEEDERLRELYDSDDEVKYLLDIAMQIEGCYRHASTHAAGMIIADRDITTVCPLYKDPRTDIPATQFSMADAEYTGLVKFDFLGLKNLTVIKQAVDMIIGAGKLPKDFDINLIPLADDPTFELLKAGHTVGVFQVESAGMTETLKKMVPDSIQYLSDVIALYRPGPMSSGMLDDFIDCRHGRKEPNYPHPALKEVLEETFGVPVYQEQIMRMAQVMAGYTLGGADMLRRAMGKKKPSEMVKHRKIFAEGSQKLHGLSQAESDKIFDLMEGFAGYGFNKAHTAAYAVVSWQTAWLKANYPLEFIAASMTLDRGNSDKVLKFKNDLDRMDVPLLMPNVNKSNLYFTVEDDKVVRFALGAIKGAGDEAMKHIVAEREANGPYTDIHNFVERQEPKYINKKQMEVLIKAGAFDEMEPNRLKLMQHVDLLLGYLHTVHEEKNSSQFGLFGGGDETTLEKPQLLETPMWSLFDKLENEQQAIGFFLSNHPLESYGELKSMNDLAAIAHLEGMATADPLNVRIAAIVHTKREVKTKSGKRMAIVLVSDTSGQEEVVLFPETYAQYAPMLEKNAPLIFDLTIQVDGERLRVSVDSISDLDKKVNRHKTVQLHLNDLSRLAELSAVIHEQKPGDTILEILYPIEGIGLARIASTTPRHYARKALYQFETMGKLNTVKASAY